MANDWLNPTLGRFLSRDPIGVEGGFNLYGYALNKPANLVDPSGLDASDAARGFGKGLLKGAGILLALTAADVEIPAYLAWTLGGAAFAYTGHKICTTNDPHERDELIGEALSIPFLPPAGYKGPVSLELEPMGQLAVRGIPRFSGDALNVAAHGRGFNVETIAEMIRNTPGYKPGMTVRLITCGGKMYAQALSQELGGASVMATSGSVGGLFPFPIPFSRSAWQTIGAFEP